MDAQPEPLPSQVPPRTGDEEILNVERPAVPTEARPRSELVGRVVSEIETSFAALESIGQAVSIFGSARSPVDGPDYRLARATARHLGAAGFSVITGGGPGVMEAANRGAQDVGACSVGLNIQLPFEQDANAFQDIELHFRYFFTRKLMFIRYAVGFVVFPGGFGTLDELFEALVLMQTGKVRDFPVVLVGGPFWSGLQGWLQERLVADGMISAMDAAMIALTDDPEEVVAIVRRHAALQGGRQR